MSKKVCIQVGHWQIEGITQDGLRAWRSPTVLKSSTGASGERDYFWNGVMPKLRDKLINAGVQVFIAGATYQEQIYSQEYDLWISLHYDGGGTGERCIISAPNRDTLPAYLNPTAQGEAERFCQLWKSMYPGMVGVPNNDSFITAGMKDYYAFDYCGMDTPAVILEHFNWTSPRGAELKNNPELVADSDFKVICKFLGISEQPVIVKDVYQIIYKGSVLQEYEFNPTDRINDLAGQLERSKTEVGSVTTQLGTCTANLHDSEGLLGEERAKTTTLVTERDAALAAKLEAERALETLKSSTAATKLITDATIVTLKKKITDLEGQDITAAYTGWELISLGISKLSGKKKKVVTVTK